jgi:hypothetical protein
MTLRDGKVVDGTAFYDSISFNKLGISFNKLWGIAPRDA